MERPASVLHQKQDVVKRRIAGETLLIPVRGQLVDMQVLFALDPTAEFIWDRIDGSRTTETILRELVETFDVDVDTAQSHLAAFVAELRDAGIIAAADA